MEYSELKKRHFGANDIDKKFTDEEIIKALECCKDCCCKQCDEEPNFQEAIDLINRQKAEIERLEKVLNGRDQLVNALNKCYKQAKSEAVKEFAEKLKNEINIRTTYSREQDKNVMRMIDNLVKEMTEVEINQRKEDEGKCQK